MSQSFRPTREGGRDEPVRLGDVIPDALAATGADREDVAWSTVFTAWEQIAGESNARHVRPVAVRHGRLVVGVEHPAWATQVRAVQSVLLRRVREVSGWAPSGLDVVVRPPESGGSSRSGGPTG